MKTYLKIALAVCFIAISNQVQAQFFEGFEGASFPPAGWTSYIGVNGQGTVNDWQLTTAIANSGAQSAFVFEEDVPDVAEDWLVTPQFTPNADFDGISFFERQVFASDLGSVYTIRVSTASQTNHADFTIIESYTETDFTTDFTQRIVDLSAFNFTPIYVAFVLEQDDGDTWNIDDVTQVKIPPCNNSSVFGNIPVPNDGSVFTTAGCVQPGDYVNYTGIVEGHQYKFSSSNPNDYITVRNGSNNGLLSFGVGDQFLTALTSDDIEVHINLDDGACGTSTTCRTASAECTNCIAIDNCNNAVALECGDVLMNESTVGSTDDGNPASCTIGVGNWYQFTPTVTSAVNLTVTPEAGYNVKLAVVTTPDCIDFTLFPAGCQDQAGDGGPERRDFVAEAGTTYHFYIGCPGATCTDVGSYDLELFCSQENWSCSTATDMSCGDTFSGETTSGAIRDIFNPGGCTAGEGLWYRFAPTVDGTATVTLTPEFDFDAQLSVLESTDCITFTPVPSGCVNTFQDGFVETLVYDYTGGTEYYFYAGNAIINSEDGNFDLSLTCDDGFCNNTTQFPGGSTSASAESNTIVTITIAQWAGDFALITNLTAGETYEFTNSSSDLITIRDAVSGDPLMSGVAPLSFTTTSNNDLEIHYNLDDGNCGTEQLDRTTTVECLTCPCPAQFTFGTASGLTGTEDGIVLYETDGEIESVQTIASTGVVTYSAGGDITLMEDFEVVQGGEFTTTHDGCSVTTLQGEGPLKYKILIKEKTSSESQRRADLNN